MVKVIKKRWRYMMVAGVTALVMLFPGYAADEPKADPAPQAELRLPVIETLDFLDDLLNEYRARYARSEPWYMQLFEEDAEAPATNAAVEYNGVGGYAQDEFSGTNVQVNGVDEADLVKTDGEFIYQVKGQEVMIVNAPPQGAMVLSAKIDLGAEGIEPEDMYVDGNY
ncbi:MAG: beta-propeller domain-containing protein, partial [Syntrophomonadaceae bacterium]|nr:beta-propeller domain-containing protein [Syntrophomonadaceae bacterium]